MELPLNQFKRGMKAGKAQIGLWSSLSSHYSVEVIAGSGFDWLLLDTEHSPNDLENVVTQLQAASAYPTTAIVRPAWNDMVLIKRFLDVAGALFGVKGLHRFDRIVRLGYSQAFPNDLVQVNQSVLAQQLIDRRFPDTM